MGRPTYALDEAPVYQEPIEKLLNDDPVLAEDSFFEKLLLRMMNNTKAVKTIADAVSDDLIDVHAQLGNKANYKGYIPDGTNLDSIYTSSKCGIYFGNNTSKYSNCPVNTNAFSLEVYLTYAYSVGVVQRFTNHMTGITYQRSINGLIDDIPQWTLWIPLATAEPPQEYSLSLAEVAENFIGIRSIYRRAQNSEITLFVAVSIKVRVEANTVFATLPVGFRPVSPVMFEAGIMTNNGRDGGNTINLLPNGQVIYFGPPLVTDDALWGQGTFLAAP